MASIFDNLFRRTGSDTGAPPRNEDLYAGHLTGQAFLSGRGGVTPEAFANTLTSDLDPITDPTTRARAQSDRASAFALQEAARIRDETDARRQQQLDYLGKEQDLASQPTLSNQDIDRMFTGAADTAAVDAKTLMASLRNQLGLSGVSGGTAAGFGSMIELQRLGQLQDSRRDLRVFKAQADAQDRIARFQRAFGIGEVMGREPSAFLADQLNQMAGFGLTREGIQAELSAAQMAADAAKDAGEQSMFGSLAGGALGVLGAFV